MSRKILLRSVELDFGVLGFQLCDVHYRRDIDGAMQIISVFFKDRENGSINVMDWLDSEALDDITMDINAQITEQPNCISGDRDWS